MIIVVQELKSNTMQLVNSFSQKQFLLFLFMFLLITPLWAQKVRSESGNINSKKYSGYSVIIKDNQSKTTDFWMEELKKVGKVRRKRDFFQIDELNLPGEYNPEAIFYSRINEIDSSTSSIWLALDPETLLTGESGLENVTTAIETYVSSLPVSYEIYTLEKQIEDTDQAEAYTQKQQQKLVGERKNLEYQLAESKAERDRLLETIDNLELEILALSQKVEDNKSDSIKLNLDLEKIGRMKEQYRQKLLKLRE